MHRIEIKYLEDNSNWSDEDFAAQKEKVYTIPITDIEKIIISKLESGNILHEITSIEVKRK